MNTDTKPSVQNSEALKTYYEPMFWNVPLDKGRLKNFVSWFLKNHGEKKTLMFLEQLKVLGFGYATKAGISLGIEDLKIPPNKATLLAEAEFRLAQSNLSYRKGETTGIEKVQRFIETWNETSENLKQEVVRYFEKTDVLNPVYMMAFSGARGNLSQVRQLVGMRGLMSDPQGKIIDFPIQSNFREGLTLTEYLISTYGARKGIVDTALRTATAGYLTRRLVDVAQHVIVSKFDCGTQRGIFLFDMKEGSKTIYSFQNRLTGRVLAQTIYVDSNQNDILASRNQELTPELAEAISKLTKKALVRSPLTCETRKLVCQLCYGWSLATSKLVSIGETVGVIAGQSIGEPGTQLTMRTFHTGGVFAANVAQQMNALFDGKVEYAAPIAGTCIRTPNGDIAFFTKSSGTLFLKEEKMDDALPNDCPRMNTYKIPAFTILFARHGQWVEKDGILAQISAASTGQKLTQTIEQTIYSSFEGEVYFNQIDILEDIDEKYGERISKAEDWAKVWVLSAKILQTQFSSPFFSKSGDFISKSSVVNQVQWTLPTSQKSLLNLPSPTTHPFVGNLTDFSATPPESFTEYSSLIKNQPISFSKEVARTQKPTAWSSLASPGKRFQILSKYSLKSRFQTSKSKNSTLGSLFQEKLFETLPTSFGYPYPSLLRSNALKIAKQTFVSLPILGSGMLESWLLTKKWNPESQTKYEISKPLTKSSMTYFIKKLNLNPRFRSYHSLKANFFHPLILSNLIPFTLEEKSIQSWLTSLTSSTKLNEKMRRNPILDSPIVEGLKTGPLAMKDLKAKQKKSSTSKFNLLKMPKDSNQDGFTGPKFEKLILNTPVLLLKVQQLNYSKFGYFASVSTSEPQNQESTGQFVSILPLERDLNVPLNQHTLYKRNQEKTDIHSFYKTINRSNQLNSLNLYGLKNSYQWSPPSQNAFFWLPQRNSKKSREQRGLFYLENVSAFQQSFYKKLLELNSKSMKNTHLNSSKYLSLLNLGHSQTAKKERKSHTFEKQIYHTKTSHSVLLAPSSNSVSTSLKGMKKVFSASSKMNPSSIFKFSALTSESYPFQKYVSSVFLQNQTEDVKKANEVKGLFSTKKRNTSFSKQLNLKLNSDAKNAIQYTELHWIPEENYQVHSFTNTFPNFKKKRKLGLFISNPSKAHFYPQKLEWYQTNSQGLKKTVAFEQEGFLKVEKVETFDPKSSSQNSEALFLKNVPFDSSLDFEILNTPSQVHKDSLKMAFLRYLKNLKKFPKPGLTNSLKEENHSWMQSEKHPPVLKPHANLILRTKTFSTFFSYVPYMKTKSMKDHFSSLEYAAKRKALNGIKEKSNLIHLTIKPGWIYKPYDFSTIFHSNKSFIESGKEFLDDVIFEQNNIFIENIIMESQTPAFESFNFSVKRNLKESSNFETNANMNFLHDKQRLKSFSYFIQNSKSRFLNKKAFAFMNSKTKNQVDSGSLHLLIRPSYYKMSETSLDMKVRLYDSMQKVRLKNFETSFCSFNQYFGSDLNPQTIPQKMLSQFLSYDLHLESVKNLGNFSQLKDSKVDVRGRKPLKSSMKTMMKKKEIKEKKWKNLKAKMLFTGSSNVIGQKSKMKFHFYLSNMERDFSAYKVSLKSSPQNLLDHGIPQIQFKSTEMQSFGIKGSKSSLAQFSEIPFFEYSIQKDYAFFGNQRLLASSFYKYQFKDFLKIPLVNDLLLNQEMFRSFRFMQKFSNQNNFGTSFYEYPFFKNYLVFKDRDFGSLQNQFIGFTDFYSSYEGEILKDYSKTQDTQTLKKGFNIYLDNANLTERANQQLILTKKDLVSFDFDFHEHDVKSYSLTKAENQSHVKNFFEREETKAFFNFLVSSHQRFQRLENHYFENLDVQKYQISDFTTSYKNKNYLLKKVDFGLANKNIKMRLGTFLNCGDFLYSKFITVQPGQIIHLNKNQMTLRKAEFFAISPKTILHTYNGHCLPKNSPVMTLPFETLKTGDIVQGIPKVEQYLEARTTIQGRLFLNSLPVLLYAIYQRYSRKLEMEKAVRQSFLKIQQILVDGVQRVYRSQGVSIADKHLEIIVRQMTSKVKIIHGGQTGFVAGELVDLEFVERINTILMVKIRYEPVVLGITRASLEVDSFLSAASFQQTTKVLTRSALENKKDFLKGLKENLLVGNLLPAGTGYVLPILEN